MIGSGSRDGIYTGTSIFIGIRMTLTFCSSAEVRGNGVCLTCFELEEYELSWVDELEGRGFTLEDEDGDEEDEAIGSGSGSGGWRACSSANASALFDWILRTARRSIYSSQLCCPYKI